MLVRMGNFFFASLFLTSAFFMHRHVSSVARKADEVVRKDKQTYDAKWATVLTDPDSSCGSTQSTLRCSTVRR